MKISLKNIICFIFLIVSITGYANHSKDSAACYDHLFKAWDYKYSDPKTSFNHVDSALQIAEKANSSDLKAKSLYYKAMLYYLQGNYGETFRYVEQSKKQYNVQKDAYGIASLHNLMGLSYQNIGAYEDAIKSYEASLIEAQKTDNLHAKSNPIHNIGLLYGLMGKPEKAIENFKKALLIRYTINDTLLIGQSFQAIGASYSEMGEKDSSIYYSVQSLKWIKSLANPSLADIALTQNNLAVVYNDIGNFIVADSLLLSSDKLARSVESYDILIKVLVNKSSGYERRGLLTEASNWADSAYYYANRYQDAVNIQGSLKIKKDIAEKLGDYKKALLIQTRINFLEDSLNTSNYINQLSILNVKNRVNEYNEEIIRQELKLSQQKVEISEQELKVKQRNYIMLVLGLITLLIFVIATFIYKQQKQKQKQLIEENQLKDQLARINLQNKLHEERLKISRDLHDNIGAQLTFIISSVDNMKHLFKSADEKLNSKLTDVANFSRTTITQLRDTIWALNKDEISFDDLKSRLYKYIENANLAQEQTVFNFNVELTHNFHLNSMQGVSIYRVVQEAINNAMKYAAATNVSLLISEKNDFLVLSIKDDGIGFNMAEIQLGNGLENMKNRASTIHAEFTINSTPNEGTEIILEIPLSEFS